MGFRSRLWALGSGLFRTGLSCACFADAAVSELRQVIGATDPAEAAEGTVRRLYAESKERNAIHASDSDENAVREARFFFAESDVLRHMSQ